MSTTRPDSHHWHAGKGTGRRRSAVWRLAGLALVLILASLSVRPSAIRASTASQTFTYQGHTETFTVPTGVTSVTITAVGAAGGRAGFSTVNPGLGASIRGDFPVKPGDSLTVLVGGQGGTVSGAVAGGGGGGSFIWTGTGAASTLNLLVAAGGGGAAGQTCNGVAGSGVNASISTAGTAGAGSGAGAGGTNGGGGGGGDGAGVTEAAGGGGGGLTGNGGDGNNVPTFGDFGGGGGQAISAGGAGGTSVTYNLVGGFGGGGGGAHSAGGGGGYSGGGAGALTFGVGRCGGGGGGSYNGGTNPTNTAGAGTGNGQVVISWTPSDTTPPTTQASATIPVTGGGTQPYTFGAWATKPVTVTLAAMDNTGGSGVATTYYAVDVATCTPAALATCSTYGAPFNVTSDGTHTLTYFSKDNAGNVESAHSQTIKIDSVQPVLAPTLSKTIPCPAPLSGACVALNSSVTASPNAQDPAPGSGVNTQSCGTVDTSSAGAHSVTCTATDVAGNTGSTMLHYSVVQVITSTTSGPLTVGQGQTVVIQGTVSGSLTVQAGGAVALQNATVRGTLTATGAAAITICGSKIQGPTSVSGSTGFVLLGDGGDDGTPACTGNTLTATAGNPALSLSSNTGGVEVGGNQVSGDVSVTGNSGSGLAAEDAGKGPEIEKNTIKGNLSCSANTPAPTNDGLPNTVSGSRGGQCAGL